MKKLLTTIAFLLGATTLFAQCKPDFDKSDKITKEKIIGWNYELYVTPLMKSAMGSSDFGVNVAVGQTGTKYEIDIIITKYETSAKKAAFESGVHGSQGSTVLLGFKEGGTPLTIKAFEVQNSSRALKSTEMYVTSVNMACYFTKEELMAFKEALTTKTIDAFRATLDGGMMLEQSIKDKRGDKMKEKFICFFDYIDKNPTK